jgi:very-short-patch-repair endonuclease
VGVILAPTGIAPTSISQARKLRRNMTAGERRLWSELREFRRWYGLHVRRQSVGRYVADFVIHEKRLGVEVDGEHHFTPDGLVRDRVRDDWFERQGYTVLRFNTGELDQSFDGCIEEILRRLGLMNNTPTPNPSPQGGGGSGGA